MGILNSESSLMEIVKLIGSDVLPDDQKLTLEIARVIRLGFLQQNAFHPDDTCVSLEKQYKMMEVILYLYKKSKALVTMGMPMSVLKEDASFLLNTMYRMTVWICLTHTKKISTPSTIRYSRRMVKEGIHHGN